MIRRQRQEKRKRQDRGLRAQFEVEERRLKEVCGQKGDERRGQRLTEGHTER